MEHTSNNRFALLKDETRPPSPINHAPPPGMFTTAADVAAMEAVATELYQPTPTPAELPLPTTPAESLNNSTLVPSLTPEGMVAINVDSTPPPNALVAGQTHSPTPHIFTEGAIHEQALEIADDDSEAHRGIEGLAEAAFDADKDGHAESSDSSTTPTAPTPSSPWPHKIPKKDWPIEWGATTPSEHSSVEHLLGDHPRRPIAIDTPTPEDPSAPSQSPPTDMGRPDPAGRMTARGLPPRPLSPMEVTWGGSTQTQAARAVLQELRDMSTKPLPTGAEISEVHAASIDEAAEWANIWADTIAPLREGYSRYTLREPIPLIKGGNRIEPAHALDTAFRDTRSRTTGSAGTSAVLASTIRGMLVSQGFFDQGTWPIEPCLDDFKLENDLESPGNQLELIRSMTEQLLSELTVQGEDRLNREDLWNSIKEQEILMLRDAMRKAAERDSAQARPSTAPLHGLIEDLEAEDSPHASGIELAKATLERVTAAGGKPGLKPNQYVVETREELRATAMAQAEREWKHWRETQFAKASGEAMRRLSIDYVIDKCGPDAQAIIAEKQNFAKEYAHCNYQNWLDQVLTERWPSVEADAQAFSREDYFNRELAAIYPEVHQEAHDAARKEALQAAALFKERLTIQKCSAASTDHDDDLYRASIKSTTAKKVMNSQRDASKKARAIKVDARRTNLAEVLDMIDQDPKEDLISHDALTALVHEDANMGTDEPPNAAAKLGAAMGLIEPLEGLAPQVRPHLGFAPSPETIGEASPSPSLPVMVALPTVNEEVAATRTIRSSVYANEAEPSPPPPAAEDHHLYAMLQQLLAPLQESVDALRLRVEVIDDRTLPTPQVHFALSASPLPPSETAEENLPVPAPAPLPPVGTAVPSKGSSSISPATKGPAGRPALAPVKQNPAPSPPGPPPREATSGARTAEVSPSPPSTGARTDPAITTPSLPDAPSPPAQPKPKGKGKAKGASTASGAPSPFTEGARTATDNDGFISVSRPKLAYNIVSAKAVQQQLATKAQASTAATAQQRTAAGRLQPGASPAPRNTTRVVVARHGGFTDATREAALRGDLPERIAASVRSAIERSTSNPIKILSGRWAKGVEKTGNYVYNITGKIPMDRILQFSKFLLQPFPGGTLIPAEGWCWAQLREVLVHDDDNNVHTEDTLFEEITRNPVFDGIPFVQRPHWERDIMKIDTATATVIFAYIDPAGKVAKEAKNAGIFMFNYGTKPQHQRS
ncbi:hypothetical protein EDB84DRAFT_1441712 [Lactarius hengduanensis]|nr:hypothetical protein EDB84DRAFT_1441712 [Lactarius hengduanensis]